MADTAQQAPQQQTPNPQPIQRPHRQRRVGSLTAGAALILTGLAIGASLLWPSFDLTMVFRLCPLILIFLGIEVVASNFAGKVRLGPSTISFFAESSASSFPTIHGCSARAASSAVFQ